MLSGGDEKLHTKIFFFVIELEGEKKKHNQIMIPLINANEVRFYCIIHPITQWNHTFISCFSKQTKNTMEM